MDNFTLSNLVSRSPNLKYRFIGCFSLDETRYLPSGTFQITNSQIFGEIGEHWLLIARTTDSKSVIFYDSFGRDLASNFPRLHQILSTMYKNQNVSIKQFFPSHSLTQSNNTTLCGLYCIFLAHFIYNKKLNSGFPMYATEEDILRFMSDNFDQAFPRSVHFL